MPISVPPDSGSPDDATMVALLKAALADNPVGVVNISVDGQTVQYSRSQALDELAYWERRVARSSGSRPRAASINLSGGFSTF